eukprot:gene24717-10355_t
MSAGIIRDALSQAIQAGAPLFNQGRPDQCYDLYRATAAVLLEAGDFHHAIQQSERSIGCSMDHEEGLCLCS